MTQITLGVEEELQVVDSASLALSPHDFDRSAALFPASVGDVDREMFAATLEIKTGICSTPDEVVNQLTSLRAVAAARAQSQGQQVLCAGLHPFSDWLGQVTNDDPAVSSHYVRVMQEYQGAARAVVSFGMHVHLGLPDPQLRMPVMNRLREFLPVVLALSANSPFTRGADTGLQSWRHAVFSRLPRTGIPQPWEDESAYWGHLDRLRTAGCLGQNAGLWEDLRLHHVFGTLEVRICDAHHSLSRVGLIVALLQMEAAALCGQLRQELTRGPRLPEVPAALLEENKWRACRYGMAATLVDWRTSEQQSVAGLLTRWLERNHGLLEEWGVAEKMRQAVALALREGTGADEQRRWRQEVGSLTGTVHALSLATLGP